MDYENRGRDGYSSRSNYSNFGNNSEGQQRPRFQQAGEGRAQQRRPRFNNSRNGNGEGGYQQRSERPRFGGGYGNQSNNEGGYQQRSERPRFGGGYGNNSAYGRQGENEGGYQQRSERPRFNSGNRFGNGGYNNEGGYQQRSERPRFNAGNNGFGNEGGFPSEARPQRPRFNNNGYRGEDGPRAFAPAGAPRPKARRTQNNPGLYSKKKRVEYIEKYEDPTKPIRLNKYLANAGVCSRREADDFIMAGVITVNGMVVSELGAKVLPTDVVKFHDQPVRREKKVYILLNKPKNTVTTTDDPQERHTVMDLVKTACSERVYPVGRLDRNTTGVLLLTNDGDLAAKLTHPKFGKKKIYAATLDKELTEDAYVELMAGVMLDDEIIVPDALEFPKEGDRKHVGLQIHSGQNRVVRRMFEKVGYKVVQLDRVSFAGLTKKNVSRGKYRFLTQQEVSMLQMGAFE
ncbi:MAG: pseudouridine synthase [Paludibacteraceae bacterium]|nr:pseudouridine synthase [Paludibacteraceae bacterium]